jgi:hypothetical protein
MAPPIIPLHPIGYAPHSNVDSLPALPPCLQEKLSLFMVGSYFPSLGGTMIPLALNPSLRHLPSA